MLNRFVSIFTSLRLTVVLLALGTLLVFWGTLAQVHLGLYRAQNEFFRSFFVFWQPTDSGLRIPVFPGGYLIGGLLLINLIASQCHSRRRAGKWLGALITLSGLLCMAAGNFWYHQASYIISGGLLTVFGLLRLDPIHGGVTLLLVGQLLTDILSHESSLHLRNGETRNYSEADRAFELAIVDTSDPDSDKVVAVPDGRLRTGGEITHPEVPFTVRVRTYFSNSSLAEKPEPGLGEVKTSGGIGAGLWWRELPHETAMDRRDMPSGIVELLTPQGSLGTFLVSGFLARPQSFTHNGRHYELSLRSRRFYKPFSLHLVEFRHDKYPGTDIPKNFSSRVRLQRPDTGEDREILIYMNSPLRYAGETFYQASFDPDDQGSILQVVHNPSWLTPYISCVLVGLGLVVQFVGHLFGHALKGENK
jgi:hypothetical protein